MRFRRQTPDITCREAVALVTDYLDDALPPRQRETFEHHLGRCPHCAEYLAQIRTTIATSGRVRTEELTPDARDALVRLYRRTLGQRHQGERK